MRIPEIKNQTIGLIEAFKKEPIPVLATAGRGAQPPKVRTAVGMAEPDENQTPVPFAVWNAFEDPNNVKVRPDTTFEDADEKKFTRLLNLFELHELPGIDSALDLLIEIEDVEPQTPEQLKLGYEKMLLQAYDEGSPLFKPTSLLGKIKMPFQYALMRRRINRATQK